MDVKVTRKTTESLMTVTLTFGALPDGYREHIETPVPFLNHMIEHIAWRAGVDIDVHVRMGDFFLQHVLYEDLGMTVGKAFREYIRKHRPDGVAGYGDAIGIIDEAKADCAISFEERAYFSLKPWEGVAVPAQTEGVLSEDLSTFLEGFAQGAQCTLHVGIQSGVNGHHIWEAVFRALGVALGRCCAFDASRAGRTAGVAGSVEYTIE